MSDLSITAANVAPGTGAQVEVGTAGETITQGMPCYLLSSDNRWYKSDNNASGKKTAGGISINAASAGQPISIQKAGQITIGATVAVGTSYYASDTAGGICAAAGVTSGMDVILLFVGISATVGQMPPGGPFVPSATVP